jgi:hypothetical protein
MSFEQFVSAGGRLCLNHDLKAAFNTFKPLAQVAFGATGDTRIVRTWREQPIGNIEYPTPSVAIGRAGTMTP